MRTYKVLALSETINTTFSNLGQNKSAFNARVLHVNQNKLNHWTLGLIHQKYGDNGIEKLSNISCKKEDWDNMYMVFSLSCRTLTVLFYIVIIIVGDYNSFSEYDLEGNYGDFETKNYTF